MYKVSHATLGNIQLNVQMWTQGKTRLFSDQQEMQGFTTTFWVNFSDIQLHHLLNFVQVTISHTEPYILGVEVMTP